MRSLISTLLAALLVFTAAEARAQSGLDVGDSMPEAGMALEDASGSSTSLAAAEGNVGTVVIFWSNASPWTDRYEPRVLSLAEEFEEQGVGFVLVNSNDPGAYPEESASAMRDRDYPVPYLVDEGSALAEAFGATRTPHVFVFDDARELIYKGAIDDSPTDPDRADDNYLREALEALVEGGAPATAETRAFGSTIKFYGS